jgi:malate dehydrogenase
MQPRKTNSKSPLRVLITGAAGQIGYSLIPLFCDGKALGESQPIILHLLDIPQAEGALEGICMEIHDGAYPLVEGIVATVDQAVGFKDVDVAVLVGGFPRMQGMTRADLLQKNCAIFKEQGASLAKHASKDCKILVVANPANTNALIAYKSCKAAGGEIPKENFTCLTRLDMNRATSQIAIKAGVGPKEVKNVTIWGNHSADQFPDVSHATLTVEGKTNSVVSALAEHKEWLEGEFISTVQNRGATVIKARGKSSAMSAANAVKDHIHDWLLGTASGTVVSMGVISDGNPYGVADDLVFSFPLTCSGGQWKHAAGIAVSESGQERLKVNESKLKEEISLAGM